MDPRTVTLKYQVSAQDYLAATQQHSRKVWALDVTIAVLVVAGYAAHWRTFGLPRNFGLAILSFWILFRAIVYFVVLPRLVPNVYSKSKLLGNEVTVTFSEQGVRMTTGKSEETLEWDFFHRCKEDRKAILLYQTEELVRIIPKRAFASEDDLRWVGGLLRERVRK